MSAPIRGPRGSGPVQAHVCRVPRGVTPGWRSRSWTPRSAETSFRAGQSWPRDGPHLPDVPGVRRHPSTIRSWGACRDLPSSSCGPASCYRPLPWRFSSSVRLRRVRVFKAFASLAIVDAHASQWPRPSSSKRETVLNEGFDRLAAALVRPRRRAPGVRYGGTERANRTATESAAGE